MIKYKLFRLFNDMSAQIAGQSNCTRLKVGAFVVSNDWNIVSMGYNGTPCKMFNCDDVFEVHTDYVVVKHLGLFTDNMFKQTIGYVPERNKKTLEVTYDDYRKLHHVFSQMYEIHAEANALMNILRQDIDIDIARDKLSIYVTTMPCAQCAKLIVAAGIKQVYYQNDYDKNEENEAMLVFNWNGVSCRKVSDVLKDFPEYRATMECK